MGPPATPEIVEEARKQVKRPLPPGPFAPTWESIRANYRTPGWFADAKFGIFIHWGLYAIPARRNEWYQKHLYGAELEWHTKTFGPPEEFGYKDFIPRFKAEEFDAEDWADLFARAGARLVMPCAQHHDNFALWDSKVTRFNSVAMGPRRDIIGELAEATRAKGMKFGVSNHGVENFTFIDPPRALRERLEAAKADLFDPEWRDFYQVADRSDAAQAKFLADWVDRNHELIDLYRPDLLWFDNGVNLRLLDPLKKQVAAYYYNRAHAWGSEVSICSKYIAYAPSNRDTEQIGSIIDFEKVGHRSPAGIRPGAWMVDDPVSSSWGFVEGMRVYGAEAILPKLVDTVSKGGFYLLNVAPRGDGAIPADQQRTLLDIGRWLAANGKAIYGTRPWRVHSDGRARFTTKDDRVHVILTGRPPASVKLRELREAPAERVVGAKLLADGRAIAFRQEEDGLVLDVPGEPADPLGCVITLEFAR